MNKMKQIAVVCCLFVGLLTNAITIECVEPEKQEIKEMPGLVAGVSCDIYDLPTDVALEPKEVEVVAEPEPEEVEESEPEPVEEPEYIEVESTAYYNRYNNYCADGTWPEPGVLAGKREWLGKSVELYDSEYNYMGTYTFHDVGYGQSTGWGSSSLLEGRSVGTIEAGQCIDIFMNTYDECKEYGRRTVYMVWKN